MRDAAARLLAGLSRVESAAAALAYTAVALLLIGDVLGRELFGQAIFGAPKIAVYAAVLAGFLGLSLATAAGSHLRPALLDGIFPKSLDTTVWRISDTVAALIFLVLTIEAARFVAASMAASDRAAVLYWLLWPIQTVIPYAFGSSALRHAIFAAWPALRPAADTRPVH